MRYKAVIFDFDDTLVKTREVKWAQHKQVARQFYGVELTDQTLREHWGKPYDETLRQFYRHADTIENMRAAKLALEAEFPLTAQVGAIEVVNSLLEAGVQVSVLSSSSKPLVIADLRRLGFPVDAFCMVQGAEDTLVHKPEPAVFQPALTALASRGITRRIVYIGDALSDWQAAKAAELDFIAVTSGLVKAAAFTKAGVKKIASEFQRIID